jgi:hypothetical protein
MDAPAYRISEPHLRTTARAVGGVQLSESVGLVNFRLAANLIYWVYDSNTSVSIRMGLWIFPGINFWL